MCIEFPNAVFRWIGVADHQDLGEREGGSKALGIITTGSNYMNKVPKNNTKNNKGGKGNGEPTGQGGDQPSSDDKGGKNDKND